MAEPDRTNADAERVSDIVAYRDLAERCLEHMGKADFQTVLNDCHAAARALRAAADIIEAQSKALVEARVYATRLLVSFVTEHCNPVPKWAPLPDLMGVLTQLDNATTITRDMKAALTELAAEDFEGSKGISIYAAAANELKRRTEIARRLVTPTPENPNG